MKSKSRICLFRCTLVALSSACLHCYRRPQCAHSHSAPGNGPARLPRASPCQAAQRAPGAWRSDAAATAETDAAPRDQRSTDPSGARDGGVVRPGADLGRFDRNIAQIKAPRGNPPPAWPAQPLVDRRRAPAAHGVRSGGRPCRGVDLVDSAARGKHRPNQVDRPRQRGAREHRPNQTVAGRRRPPWRGGRIIVDPATCAIGTDAASKWAMFWVRMKPPICSVHTRKYC